MVGTIDEAVQRGRELGGQGDEAPEAEDDAEEEAAAERTPAAATA